jgi:hypothetical protein
METALVYGIIDNNLVIAPESMAIETAGKWQAIHHAKTWQDFIDFTSQESFDQLMYEILETLDFEDLYPQYLMGEDLSNYITDLHLPQPEDPFDIDVLPGHAEGTYMPVLAQEIIAWLPEELHDHLGHLELHPIHEFIYKIAPEQTQMVVQTLEAAGYTCKLNQRLMEQAHGL